MLGCASSADPLHCLQTPPRSRVAATLHATRRDSSVSFASRSLRSLPSRSLLCPRSHTLEQHDARDVQSAADLLATLRSTPEHTPSPPSHRVHTTSLVMLGKRARTATASDAPTTPSKRPLTAYIPSSKPAVALVTPSSKAGVTPMLRSLSQKENQSLSDSVPYFPENVQAEQMEQELELDDLGRVLTSSSGVVHRLTRSTCRTSDSSTML